MLSVTEKNFSPEGADVTVTAQDPEGKDTGAYAESSVDAVRTSEWDRNGSTWTFSMDDFEKTSPATGLRRTAPVSLRSIQKHRQGRSS